MWWMESQLMTISHAVNMNFISGWGLGCFPWNWGSFMLCLGFKLSVRPGNPGSWYFADTCRFSRSGEVLLCRISAEAEVDVKEGDSDATLKLTSQVWTYLERRYVRRLMLARVQGEFEAAAVVRSLSLRGSNQQSQLSITDLHGLVGFFSETRLLRALTQHTSPWWRSSSVAG